MISVPIKFSLPTALQECRRAYEQLPSEAQYRVKQLCAKFEAVRTYPEAFMNAIHDVTGQNRPHQQPDQGRQLPFYLLQLPTLPALCLLSTISSMAP